MSPGTTSPTTNRHLRDLDGLEMQVEAALRGFITPLNEHLRNLEDKELSFLAGTEETDRVNQLISRMQVQCMCNHDGKTFACTFECVSHDGTKAEFLITPTDGTKPLASLPRFPSLFVQTPTKY